MANRGQHMHLSQHACVRHSKLAQLSAHPAQGYAVDIWGIQHLQPNVSLLSTLLGNGTCIGLSPCPHMGRFCPLFHPLYIHCAAFFVEQLLPTAQPVDVQHYLPEIA